MIRHAIAAALALLLLLPASRRVDAQEHAAHAPPTAGQPHERPDGWKVRYDRANAVDSTLFFTAMSPGWHVTTGPSGILWHPDRTASGNYDVRSELFLFPAQRLEGFGIFIGGSELEEPGQRYTYFLLRKDGRFLVKHRDGGETRDLIGWTEHDAIAKHESTEGTVRHVLGVRARPDSVTFLVNDVAVATLPRSAVSADGIVGLRVNHALNLHVTSLEVLRP